jgi:hypothetical protein
LAGAYYGLDAIPSGWREKTVLLPLILDMAGKLEIMAFPPIAAE